MLAFVCVVVVIVVDDEYDDDDDDDGTLTHCERVTQICVFNTVKLGTSASSP